MEKDIRNEEVCKYDSLEGVLAFFKLMKPTIDKEYLFEELAFFVILNDEFIEKYHELKCGGYESNNFHVLPVSSLELSQGLSFDINLVLTVSNEQCIPFNNELRFFINKNIILGAINFPNITHVWDYYRLIDVQFISKTTKLIFNGVDKESYGISNEESTV